MDRTDLLLDADIARQIGSIYCYVHTPEVHWVRQTPFLAIRKQGGRTGRAHPGPQVRRLQQLQVQREARGRVWVGLRSSKEKLNVLDWQTGHASARSQETPHH